MLWFLCGVSYHVQQSQPGFYEAQQASVLRSLHPSACPDLSAGNQSFCSYMLELSLCKRKKKKRKLRLVLMIWPLYRACVPPPPPLPPPDLKDGAGPASLSNLADFLGVLKRFNEDQLHRLKNHYAQLGEAGEGAEDEGVGGGGVVGDMDLGETGGDEEAEAPDSVDDEDCCDAAGE